MFKSARIKLTFSYLLIISIITIGFSFFLYQGITNTTRRAMSSHQMHLEDMYRHDKNAKSEIMRLRRFQDPVVEETIKSIKHGVFLTMFVIDLIIILTSGLLGYLLAGFTLKPIEKMLDNQKRFIANAAHELKTPITAIRAMFEVSLRDKNLNLKLAKDTIKKGILEVDDMDKLIKTLLTESKYQENAKKPFKTENVIIYKNIENVVNKMKVLADKKGIKINTKLDLSKKDTIKFQKASFEELITILLDNAIKYNKKDSKIDLSANIEGKYLYISVQDYGIGISNKDLQFIFDRFYKVDKSRSKDGFGLGLSIVKDILDAYKGEIKVKSSVGKGSIFTIKLPV